MVYFSNGLKISRFMKHKILIIDDERSIRLLLENFLSENYSLLKSMPDSLG